MTDIASTWTPAQRKVAEELLAIGQERPVADLSWALNLAEWIDGALDGIVSHTKDRPLWIGKSAVSGVLGCEAHYLAGRGQFAWTRHTAKGEIIHRAVALSGSGPEDPQPRELIRWVIGQAREGRGSIGTWLRGLDENERLALITDALPAVDGFLANWPPLKASWHPVPEYPLRVNLAGGRVRLTGRVDLALGLNRVDPSGFLRRRRMLVEMKSGRPNHDHRAEHLLYALVECLKSGVAPCRAATYYLDEGTWIADDITEELLTTAAERLVEGVKRVVELGEGREPKRQAGWRCAFCPLADGCPERLSEREDGILP